MNEKNKIKQVILLTLFLILCYFVGGGIAVLTSATINPSFTKNTQNWGLGFQTEGQPPTGNATVQQLNV